MNTDKLILKIVLVLAIACAAFSAAFDAMSTGLKKISGSGSGSDDDGEETPKPSTRGKKTGKAKEQEEEEQEEEEEEQSLPELGEAADDGDEDAQAALSAKAVEADLDENAYPTWVELADALAELKAKPAGKKGGKPAGKSKGGVTLADLREKAKPIIRAGFSTDVKELLESFDADSLTTLDEGQFEKFDKALDKLATRLGVEE